MWPTRTVAKAVLGALLALLGYSGIASAQYVANNPLRYIDPDGLEVRVVTGDPVAAKILMEAYAKLNRTKKGQEICRQLEQSSDIYKIKPINRDAFYCPPSVTSQNCAGNPRTIFIDPYNNIVLPTTSGMQPAPKPVVLGHELGHAIGYDDDGPNYMNNVNANENPIRQQLGLPPRNSYLVPEEQWVPGTK
jgi:hypothetical protein